MTATVQTETGASSAKSLDWNAINWQSAEKQVHRLQMRIAKAYREGKHGKVKSLQWILTHSFLAKVLAVKRVTQNKGGKTPGVDNIVWKTPLQKMRAALSLKRRGYQPQPLKRIYIPKKQKGKLRPLSIPTCGDRAQQALHLLALEPVTEMLADRHAYGFRPLRSTADAVAQCFNVLARRVSAQYILEGDIKSCFDKISHSWLLQNTPTDKKILEKWLKAGYIEKGACFDTEEGTAQGGPISPALLNVTLSGLERAVKSVVSRKDKVNICIYADDFIITGATREVLENKVKPALGIFLKERGLVLSQDKTLITHIAEGFNFLGVNLRKYNGKLITKPTKSNIKKFLEEIRKTIKSNCAARQEHLIRELNPKILGWANHYCHTSAKRIYGYVHTQIFQALWRWACRRHPQKNKAWIKRRYFHAKGLRDWIFATKVTRKNSKGGYYNLITMSRIPIVRHIKLRAEVTPYHPEHRDYLDQRRKRQERTRIAKRRAMGRW